MKNLLMTMVLVAMLFSAFKLKAHQPDISSFSIIEQAEGEWIINLNASITAFQYEIEFREGKNSYSSIEEFQQLLLKHIEENLDIRINGTVEPSLSDGKVLVGHATTVVFKLNGAPTNMEEVFLKNSSFQNINSSSFIFIIQKMELDEKRFIVSRTEDYQINVTIHDKEIASTEIPFAYNWSGISILATAVGLLVFITVSVPANHPY